MFGAGPKHPHEVIPMAKKAKTKSRTTVKPPKKDKALIHIMKGIAPGVKVRKTPGGGFMLIAAPGGDFPVPPFGTAAVCGYDGFGNRCSWLFPGAEKYFKGGPEGTQKWTNT